LQAWKAFVMKSTANTQNTLATPQETKIKMTLKQKTKANKKPIP
jgi:hypothetical protein